MTEQSLSDELTGLPSNVFLRVVKSMEMHWRVSLTHRGGISLMTWENGGLLLQIFFKSLLLMVHWMRMCCFPFCSGFETIRHPSAPREINCARVLRNNDTETCHTILNKAGYHTRLSIIMINTCFFGEIPSQQSKKDRKLWLWWSVPANINLLLLC